MNLMAVLNFVQYLYLTIRGRKPQRRAFLREKGIRGTGTVLQVGKTGAYINQVPQFLFKIKVVAAGNREVTTSCKKFVDSKYLPKLEKGLQIPALIDPANDEKILLLWEEAGIEQAF
ncbi:MAG TPA: hypothetical protein VIR29_05230 [Anseongella sp.]